MVLLGRLPLEAVAGRRHPAERLSGADARLGRRQPRAQKVDDAIVRDVARGRDDDVVGRVGRAVVGGQRLLADARDHLGAADHGPSDRVATEDGFGHEVVDQILWVVVDHRDLLEHDLPLGVDLGEGGVVDHPRHHVERRLEPVVGHAGVDERRLARSGGVELAAEPVEDLRDLLRRVRARALEEQMFDEVQGARAGVRLVARAGADPETERDRANVRNVLGDHTLAGRER